MKFIYSAFILTTLLFSIHIACAAPDHSAQIDNLINDKKYLTAAEYINEKPELMEQDEYFRKYVYILVNYYAMTINYNMFALRDLEKHENIDEIRGQKGTYKLLGVKLEEQLFERWQESPDSPHLNFAIGEYLSRGYSCGCLKQTEYFVSANDSDSPFFAKSFEGGISDYWSLFRLGMNHHVQGNLEEAIKLYQMSLALSDIHPATIYNLAVALYQDHQDKKAKTYAKMALGIYGDDELDSDTYDLYGSILFDEGNYTEAEKHLTKSLELKAWHPHAFKTLLQLYEKQAKSEQYRALANKYIAIDYSNTFLFNNYIEHLTEANVNKDDLQVMADLSNRTYDNDLTTVAVFFNLGRLYAFTGDNETARIHLKKSLTFMNKLENPPDGAIKSLNKLLEDVSK